MSVVSAVVAPSIAIHIAKRRDGNFRPISGVDGVMNVEANRKLQDDVREHDAEGPDRFVPTLGNRMLGSIQFDMRLVPKPCPSGSI